MEVIAGLQTAQAVQEVLGNVVTLVQKILQARRDVRDLPKDIDELLEEVKALKPVTDSIKAGSSDKDGFLKPHLEKLQKELDRALKQLDGFKEKQKQDTSSTFSKVAKATVNRGDSQRKKEISSIRDTIKGLREALDKALNASTHLTGESTHAVVRMIHSTGESSHTIVEQTHLKVDAIFQKTIVDPSPSVVDVTPPPIIAKLEKWARLSIENESFKIHFMIWDDEKNVYRLPEQEDRRETGEDEKDEEEGEIKRAGAREGVGK